eukprot:COSAG02_NODE_104_length_36421_cov_132.465420_20_plen_89_part_00
MLARKIYAQVKSVELHVGYVHPSEPYIPPSQSRVVARHRAPTAADAQTLATKQAVAQRPYALLWAASLVRSYRNHHLNHRKLLQIENY